MRYQEDEEEWRWRRYVTLTLFVNSAIVEASLTSTRLGKVTVPVRMMRIIRTPPSLQYTFDPPVLNITITVNTALANLRSLKPGDPFSYHTLAKNMVVGIQL